MLRVLKTYLLKATFKDGQELSLQVSEKDLDSLLKTLQLNEVTKVEYYLRERGKLSLASLQQALERADQERWSTDQ